MGIARSTFYEEPMLAHDDTEIIEVIAAICDEFEFYGWRRDEKITATAIS